MSYRCSFTSSCGRDGAVWEHKRSSKRCHDQSLSDDYVVERSRARLVGDGGEDSWLPHCKIEQPTLEEEEEQVFLVPGAACCFPPLASSACKAFWPPPDHRPQSDSSSSSGARSSSLETDGNGSEIACLNGSACMHPWGMAGEVRIEGENSNLMVQQEGLELASLLSTFAECIGTGNYGGISFTLSRLGELASPTGASIHRVAAYFTEALTLRAAKLWPRVFSVALPRSPTDPTEDDDGIAWRLLNCVGPIPKFIHFTANERLLRAFEGKDRVHIIDFDVRQGLQWPSLLQCLASRPNPPSHVRITGVGECRQDLQDTGARLARIAAELNLPFRFHAVVDRLEDVRLWMLHVKRDECVAVNCALVMHRVLYGEDGGALKDLLGLIRSTNPTVLVMAEQEAEHNEDRWARRLSNSLRYYSAMFDSLDCALHRDCPARIKVEEMLAREIRNIVACEGSERVERHESFDRWKMLMEDDNGFKLAGIGESEMLHGRMVLRMYNCDNYSVNKRGDHGVDGITLKWFDQPLYTVSAWEPVDTAAGSSSSTTSHPN